jgi:hypothetical protein
MLHRVVVTLWLLRTTQMVAIFLLSCPSFLYFSLFSFFSPFSLNLWLVMCIKLRKGAQLWYDFSELENENWSPGRDLNPQSSAFPIKPNLRGRRLNHLATEA